MGQRRRRELLRHAHELIRRRPWATKASAKRAVAEYIELLYSPVRLHSHLSYVNPKDYERTSTMQDALAA